MDQQVAFTFQSTLSLLPMDTEADPDAPLSLKEFVDFFFETLFERFNGNQRVLEALAFGWAKAHVCLTRTGTLPAAWLDIYQKVLSEEDPPTAG